MYEYPQSNYSPQMMAIKLNNRAASCIETGRYESAIEYLTKSLETAREEVDDDDEHAIDDASSSPYCALDECIRFSRRNGRRRAAMNVSSEHDTKVGYIYETPIRFSPQAQKMQATSPTIELIATYNLALAYHLSAVKRIIDKKPQMSKLSTALKLYELTYRWVCDEQLQSLGFAMIISNNVGQIHRASKDQRKHETCMKHLLSMIMYSIVNEDGVEREIEMDGFFQNTTPFVLQSHCAGAA